MKTKSFFLLTFTEEGFLYEIRAQVIENGTFMDKGNSIHSRNSKVHYKRNREKQLIRNKDYQWVIQNIPSSIWWHTEIHHNWANNGTMYLLTKGEHILRHRSEKG